MQQAYYKTVSNTVYLHSAMDLLAKVRPDQLSPSQHDELKEVQAKLKFLASASSDTTLKE